MKRNNIVSLSVHKNNKIQRRRRQRRRSMISASKNMANSDCVEGYFFISWNKNGDYQVRTNDPDRVIGYNALPDYVGGCARRTITDLDNEHDD